MRLMIPIASRILPLTKKNFDILAAASGHPGKIVGFFTDYSVPPNWDEDPNDAELAGRQFAGELIQVRDPDFSRCYGPFFNTFLYHDDLAGWIGKLHSGGFGIQLELLGNELNLSVQLTPEFRPRLNGRSICLAYATEDAPEISWTKPPHDPEFLRRAMPVLYRDQEREFTSPGGQWFMNLATSPAEGVFILHGQERILAVVDHERYPTEAEGARLLEDGHIMLFDITPPGESEGEWREAVRHLVDMDVYHYARHILYALAFKRRIQLPQPIERRWFFWQTYLEGIKRPGQR